VTENQRKPVILAVDDIPENLDVLVGILKANYQMKVATNGERALQLAVNEPQPDLILLDIMMPIMNGYEVCNKLKADDSLKDIPVIFISALDDTLDKVEAFNCGGVDYIAKPFQVEEVVARVETHLNLRRYRHELELKNLALGHTLEALKKAQMKVVESEKMASLGVLAAGIAHEINNPINFISSGINGLKNLIEDLHCVVKSYEQITPDNVLAQLSVIRSLKDELEYAEVEEGISQLLASMATGVERTAGIVKGLRTFSRLDEADKKMSDVHENIDSALMMLSHEYKNDITIVKQYGDIPQLLCYPGKLNQVFMNVFSNAIDAIRSKDEQTIQDYPDSTITVHTSISELEGRRYVLIRIKDTGSGISETVLEHIFEPFFTTKEVGVGVGLGLAISYSIIQEHNGLIRVNSEQGKGAEFNVYIPL